MSEKKTAAQVLAECIALVGDLEDADKARAVHGLADWYRVPPQRPTSLTSGRPQGGASR